jgi:argininosuccinate lyase
MTLWSGRFQEPPDDVLWRFTVDHSDRRMLVDDIVGSIAHVEMLGDVKVLTAEEVTELTRGLIRVKAEAESDEFSYHPGDEDIHSAVERRLGELIGTLAGKLHTGRSRNDQVALDVRLYLRRMAIARIDQIRAFAAVMADLAEANIETVVPSYTHMQQAQPVPLGHHLLAYAWMLLRDADRFSDVGKRLDISPLGASAGGGTSLPLDPARSAVHLGMSGAFENSMDAVAARDLVAEYAFCCAQAMVHLSRLAEEVVLWASREFGWATFADRYTTGSSAMPQKKNPDIAELVRGRAAPAIGHLTTLLALQKGTPMTYNRDFQEDKAAVFAADDVLAGSLEAITAMLATAEFHPPVPGSWVAALDLAEALVERGVPFRDAHEAIGRLVARMIESGRELSAVTAADLSAAEVPLDEADLSRLDPTDSIRRRVSGGGASFESVRSQIVYIRGKLTPR